MDEQNNIPIDMATHFDVSEELDKLAAQRFAMPPAVVAAFKQAAQVATMRLLTMVSDEATFNKLSTNSKLKVMDMIFDRAYGKNETASASQLANHRTGAEGSTDKGKHAQQLDAIAERAAAQASLSTRRHPARLRGPAGPGDSFDDGGDGSLTSLPHGVYPELSGKRSRGAAQRNSPVTGDGVVNLSERRRA